MERNTAFASYMSLQYASGMLLLNYLLESEG